MHCRLESQSRYLVDQVPPQVHRPRFFRPSGFSESDNRGKWFSSWTISLITSPMSDRSSQSTAIRTNFDVSRIASDLLLIACRCYRRRQFATEIVHEATMDSLCAGRSHSGSVRTRSNYQYGNCPTAANPYFECSHGNNN